MNRQITGTLAVILAIACPHAVRGQVAAPSPMGYPAQHAVYMTPYAGPSAVYPAAGPAGPSGVQLASCPSCGPGGEMMNSVAAMGPVGCDSPGCDSGMCGPGGGGILSGMGGGCGPMGCGPMAGGPLAGMHGAMQDFGNDLAGGYGGYNSQHLGKQHGPYGDGGCCQPQWFDVRAEWLYWQRDYSDQQAFSAPIQGNTGPDPNDIALDANMLDFSEESGYRVTGAYLIGPSTSIEAGYFGGFNYASSAVALGNASLFSVFSGFGNDPFNGFPETAFGNRHSLAISSEMDSAEINLRRRLVSANCLLHSSLLAGARYFRFREDLLFATLSNTASMDYGLTTDNDLVGAQLGGDLAICITPRFKVGVDAKAGVYGTGSRQRTNVITSTQRDLRERVEDNDVAFLGEGGASAVYRINSHLSLRAGYQVLYVSGIATAVDNFNTVSPFTAREALLDNNGDVFFHGSTLGFEFTH